MRLAEGIILSHVDDGAIVLDSNRGVYFRLNRTASSVLEMLLSGLSKEETAKRISVSMEVDEGEVLNDRLWSRTDVRGEFFVGGD